jgi:hypothetical protein
MKLEIEVPDYNKSNGMKLKWEDGFKIEVKEQSSRSVLIKANKAGLFSLARHLLALSVSSIPTGYHLHFDDLNSLEDGSCELIIEKWKSDGDNP